MAMQRTRLILVLLKWGKRERRDGLWSALAITDGRHLACASHASLTPPRGSRLHHAIFNGHPSVRARCFQSSDGGSVGS